jgi:hypothetical protein
MQLDSNIQTTSARRRKRLAFAAVAVLALFGSCMGPPMLRDWKAKQQRERAYAMWQERCKKSGELIRKTVDDVEGVYLVNVRTSTNFGEQFELDDPYGHDSTGDNYILNFLQGYYHQQPRTSPPAPGEPPRVGYRYVEAFDPKEGQLYRYTGRVEEPWQTNKSYLQGYTRFVLDKTPIAQRTARYGVKFEDISTHEEREHWIAGSSLKVLDLQTQEVIAERVGYMVDWAQGSRAGQRSPWLFAADNACPSFTPLHLINQGSYGSQSQAGQTLDFTEKALKPIHRDQ